MDKWNVFQRFLVTENAHISVNEFLINTLVILVLSLLLEFTYTRCAHSLSERRSFAANFFLVAFTTMLIISIVKSSLALSLGLVGALSIVRFRSAIKEPEELAFLFITISIGLGLGAEKRIITVIGALVLIAVIWVRHFMKVKTQKQNLFLTVSSVGDLKLSLERISETAAMIFPASKLVRYDETDGIIEVAYWIEVRQTSDLQRFRSVLNEEAPGVKVSFVNNNSF